MIIYIKKTKKQKSGQREKKKGKKVKLTSKNTSHQMDDKNLKMPKSPSAIYQEDTH